MGQPSSCDRLGPEMASTFDMPKIRYALEKLGDFIHGSGSGADVPGWADTNSKVIVDGLHAFEEKLRMHGTPADEIDHDLGPAIYAACQLQSYVTRDKSEIVSQTAARLYLDFLEARIKKLRRLEQDLDP